MNDRAFRGLAIVLGALFGMLLIGPLATLVLHGSPGRLATALGQTRTVSAIALSLATATIATMVAIVGGLPLAWLLRHPHGRAARWLGWLCELPLVLPPAVAGLALLLALGPYGPGGRLLTRLGWGQVPLTPAAVVLAQVLVAGPLFLRAARSAMAAVPERLLHASALLGGNEWDGFRRVLLPLAKPGLVGGALLCWARAIGELGATLMFAGSLPGRTMTMATAIFVDWQTDLDAAIALAIVLLIVSGFAIFGARQLAVEPGS